MKRSLLATVLSGVLAAGVVSAAESDDLAAQTSRMDSLATSPGNARVESRISSDFTSLAGSTANSDALVAGLRNGSAITLSSTDAKGVTTSTTFSPPTGRMGYGNVYTSLALAKEQLAGLGITQPTTGELQAALVGGTVTANGQTTTLNGVLALRAQGMGWGQIAQQYGTKLGPVISGMKSANSHVASQAGTRPAGGSQTGAAGVTTAAGGAANSGRGNAYGRGITTGAGGAGTPAQGQGNAYGRGIVTGAGSVHGQGGAAAAGKGKGN